MFGFEMVQKSIIPHINMFRFNNSLWASLNPQRIISGSMGELW